ncbi:hypothetical protein [Glycomyces buryatensis]|uniref:Uncharacterized protein n=1 Tax=Glycomyces buryatensis TaxID=2570927 RepID=A0A4S8QG62_9ACTN|nr:hypothetical protein [Glycomyces buryatensis]THV39634.1 hypothetical protein FAB82_17340 [Glycomyces buryatensis]
MSEEKRFTLFSECGNRRTSLVLETDFPSVELARAGAIERVAIHNPWLNEGELANAVEPLQSLGLEKSIKVNGFTYSIRPIRA